MVGPGPDNGRIMMTPAPIALRYHRPPRPVDHIFPAFFPVSLPHCRLPRHRASLSRIEISIQSCASTIAVALRRYIRGVQLAAFLTRIARICWRVHRPRRWLKVKGGRNRRISATDRSETFGFFFWTGFFNSIYPTHRKSLTKSWPATYI